MKIQRHDYRDAAAAEAPVELDGPELQAVAGGGLYQPLWNGWRTYGHLPDSLPMYRD